ncbi:hypothetical protein L3Q82_026780, partial [Scortum barcoo]
MWAGLKTLTDYKKKISSAEVMSASLPDELNTFMPALRAASPAVEVQKAQEDHCPPVISRADVCRTLKRINTHPRLCGWAAPHPSTLTLNTGAPQGCVLSPLLYSLFTHDCVATHSSNTIVKFADGPVDTTVLGLITGNDEAAYREVRAAALPSTVKALQREVKAAQHITRTELCSTSTPSGVGRRPPKSLRTPVTQLQTVLPAAVLESSQVKSVVFQLQRKAQREVIQWQKHGISGYFKATVAPCFVPKE